MTTKTASAAQREELKGKAATNGHSSNTQNQANRSHTSANQAQDVISKKIQNARNAVRKNTKAQIIVGGISDALNDIACGNFDDIELDVLSALDIFTTSLNEAHDTLITIEASPSPLLLTSASDLSFREVNSQEQN